MVSGIGRAKVVDDPPAVPESYFYEDVRWCTTHVAVGKDYVRECC